MLSQLLRSFSKAVYFMTKASTMRSMIRYLQDKFNTGNLARFRNVTRMDEPTFESLLFSLERQGEFKNSKYLSTGEKLLMFILVLVGNSNRGICERWQHSGSTTSLVVHEVAAVMLRCHDHFLFPAKVDDPVPPQILNSYKYTPYFNDCIGALDGGFPIFKLSGISNYF